jgi:hypothetical protein
VKGLRIASGVSDWYKVNWLGMLANRHLYFLQGVRGLRMNGQMSKDLLFDLLT